MTFSTFIAEPFAANGIRLDRPELSHKALAYGTRGSGTTLWLVAVSAFEKQIHGDHLVVLSNIPVEHADIVDPEIASRLLDDPDTLLDGKPGLLIVDCFESQAQGERPSSKARLAMQLLLKRARQMGLSVICSTSMPKAITLGDARLFDFHVEVGTPDQGRSLDTFWWDVWAARQHKFPQSRGTHDLYYLYHNTARYFAAYDTAGLPTGVS